MTILESCCQSPRDRAEIRRQRIIDASRNLFIQNGFHATGVAQIAKESGIAIGQIYRDFESKEDIVAAIVQRNCTTFMAPELLHQAIAAGDVSSVWQWIRQFVEPTDHDGTQPLFAEIIAESARNQRIAAIFMQMHDEVSALMLSAFALLAPGDHIADRRAALVDLILAQSLGLMQHRLLNPNQDADRLVDMIMAIIAREIDSIRKTTPVAQAIESGVIGNDESACQKRTSILAE